MELWTLKETADFLRCSQRHLQDLRKQNGFPQGVVLGQSTIRYVAADMEEWVLAGGLSTEGDEV